jgi:ketosteroid isomerase-like protein
MTLAERDRIDITELIHLHGHLMDGGELERTGELFTPDITYDVEDFGLGTLSGLAALRDAALAVGAANPVGHHVTNVVITGIDERSAQARSKGIGIMADGTAGSVVYDDVVTRTPDGWRISHRKVTARRAPLGGRAAGPGEVVERWRRASVNRSTDAMRSVYAAAAVHEFPFAYPGVPSRLEGREEIVSWIAAGWAGDVPRFDGYRTLALHTTADPQTVVVEQEAFGTSASTGAFTLPSIVVLTAHDGQILRLRDYVDVRAAAAVLGRAG